MAGMDFYLVIAVIALFIYFSRLNKRVLKLEKALSQKTLVTPVPAPKPASAPAVLPAASGIAVASDPVALTPSEPDVFQKFFNWCTEDWLLKLGALLLLIGFGWLVTYAFLNNWIGPMGRIALGIFAGVAILLLGRWRIMQFVHQGSIFLALGSTVILLTIFAAREVYDFFTPGIALAVMFLSTAFIALTSVQYKTKALGVISLALAGIAPLLTSSPSADYVSLFAYLFIVVLGTVWIVLITGWRQLTTAAFILILFYSLPHLTGYTYSGRNDLGALLLFSYAFATVFFITNTAAIIKQKSNDIVADLVTAGGNGLLLLAWIMMAAHDEWKSLLIAAWMIVFAFAAFTIFKITNRKEPFYVYAGVGIAMLAAATSAEFSGATLVIAYAIESAMISLVTYFIMRDIKLGELLSLLLIGPIILSFESLIARAWRTSIFHRHFFVILIIALVLLGLGMFFREMYRRTGEALEERFYPVLIIGGSVYAYALVWLSLHAAFMNDDIAKMLALFVYTVAGLISYLYGTLHLKKVFRLYGGVLLGLVVLRLLMVDIWDMALSGRIITFFIIGALLMSTAFIGRKKIIRQ